MAGKSDASGRGSRPAVDRLIADAAELLGPVQFVDYLTFSNKATVVRLRVADGTTMIAKQPRRREMFVRELEALPAAPCDRAPGPAGLRLRLVRRRGSRVRSLPR